MPKFIIFNRLLNLNLSTFVGIILCLIAIIQFFGYYGVYNYPHVPVETLDNYIYKAVNPHLVIQTGKPNCEYQSILKSTKSLNSWEVPKKYDDFAAKGVANGSYTPEHCNPLFSIAILVTYRNRQKQLDIFLPYIHNFLRKQNIHYKIYLIEQQDEKPWNKGALYNIGAKQAIADKFPCLILHDVDLLPLDESNLYVCMEQPRHLSTSIDKFRYVLTYDYLVGGVLAIKSQHYIAVNGFSNKFEHWGGEDDDFAQRLADHKFEILRFPQNMSTYTMLVHKHEEVNGDRHRIMAENKLHSSEDGLSSMKYGFGFVQVKVHRLFTLIGVKL